MARSRQVTESGIDEPLGRRTLLLLVASNRRRGAEVFGERLADGFTSLGWGVDFVSLQSVDAERLVSATPLSTKEGISRLDLSMIRSLRNHIATIRPSVILANGGATLRYGAAATTMLKHRPLLAYSAIGEPRYWLRSGAHTRLQRFLYTKPDVVLAVSHATRDQLVDDLGVQPDRVHFAPTGVAPEYFVKANEPHEELRMLFLGSMSPEKGPRTALEVADRIRHRHTVRLRFVGDGPMAAEIEREASGGALANIVEFSGSVDDVTPHLQWSDLLVLPSATEGLPGAVLEAGAAGVPAVAFDVGGTSETMVDGVTGRLVTPGDTEAMVHEVDALAGDRQHLEQLGQEATRFVQKHFTLQASVQRYEKILATALSGSSTR